LRPQPRALWEEPLPVIADWSRTPGAFLQFTSTYDVPARQARGLGWPYRNLDGGHFHMLVDPAAVATAVLELAQRMCVIESS
jgi:hypothetical protein